MGQGVGGDYIRTYLGLMGSGKTTQAVQDAEKRNRVIVYGPGASNHLLRTWPWIYDTPEYLKDLNRFLGVYPKLRIEKRAFPSPIFKIFSQLKGYTILVDDVAAVKTQAEERADFEAFIRTVRFNGNQLILTTHRARGDLSPLVRNLGTSFYYVGPSHRSKQELDCLYELTNYPIDYDDFVSGLINNRKMGPKGNPPAGIFPIRRP